MELSDEQWLAVRGCFPKAELKRSGEKGGRPYRDPRDVLSGVLWVLRTGAPWSDLPVRYPPYQTCHRRYQQWVRSGLFERVLRRLAEDLRSRGKLDLTEAFIDGSHAGAKKGALLLAKLDAAKRPNSWQWRTATVFLSPAGLRVVSAMRSSSSTTRSLLALSGLSQSD